MNSKQESLLYGCKYWELCGYPQGVFVLGYRDMAIWLNLRTYPLNNYFSAHKKPRTIDPGFI